jgi:23S rRNA (pseudouridine1915-N3)-methyltransferase
VKLLIACIGRAGRGPERDLYEHYASRIRWPLALRELEEKRKLPPPQMILREGELLLDAVAAKSVLVALDRRGKVLDSEGAPSAAGALAHLVSDGFPDRRRRRAWRPPAEKSGTGPGRWRHDRPISPPRHAGERFRAQQLLAGHPYHRV